MNLEPGSLSTGHSTGPHSTGPHSTGMARKVDDLGRIVLPAEMRRMFGIRSGDELEISVDGGAILLRKREASCVFCEAVDGLRELLGKQVCRACGARLQGFDLGPSQGDLVDAPLGDTQVGGHPGQR